MVRSTRIFEDPEVAEARQTASLAALALSLALVVAGLYLVDTLRAMAAQQDCLITGRLACQALLAAQEGGEEEGQGALPPGPPLRTSP